MGTARASTTTCFATTWVALGRLARSSQIKECPLATCRARLQPNTTLCRARLQRTRDVECDTLLKTGLSAAPPNTTLQGCEVRMEAAPTAVEGSVRYGGRKRSQRGTSLAVHGESESRSRRCRGRRCGLWEKHKGNGVAPEGICAACRPRSIRRSQLVG